MPFINLFISSFIQFVTNFKSTLMSRKKTNSGPQSCSKKTNDPVTQTLLTSEVKCEE